MFVLKSQNPEDPKPGWSCLVQTTTPAARSPGLHVILTNASLPAGWVCLKRINVEKIWDYLEADMHWECISGLQKFFSSTRNLICYFHLSHPDTGQCGEIPSAAAEK
jgi:hypothetical protein